MKKLAFLSGKRSGEALVTRGPGEPLKIQQTEDVQYRLDGLVLLVEGTGRDPQTGKVVFNALATIAWDEATNSYRFRAFNSGRYLDTELKVLDGGFEWGHEVGPAAVRNVMKLDEKGEWVETTEVSIGGAPPRRMLEMRVRKDK